MVRTCPSCETEDNGVIDSRPVGTTIRRRRQCCKCAERWTTYEVSQATFQAIANVRSALHAGLDALAKAAELFDAVQADGLVLVNGATTNVTEDAA